MHCHAIIPCQPYPSPPPMLDTAKQKSYLIGCLKGDWVLLTKVESAECTVLGVTLCTLQRQSPCTISQLFSLLVS